MAATYDVAVDLDSGHVCACCEEPISMLEEVLCLEVVLPVKLDVVKYYILEDDTGGYAYEPYFFHVDCWVGEVEEALCTVIEDTSPALDSRGIIECEGCTSDIFAWETCGIVSIGEFTRIPQSQDGTYPPRFVPYEIKSRPFCVSCLHTINEQILEMWEGGITHRGACEEGISCRCWRYESCNEPGKAHCRMFDEVDG